MYHFVGRTSVTSTQTPLVSVLVPICNVEKYLDECLESARAQTLKDIEVICINDGSTDGSLDIIKSFMDRDPRFRVIDKPNSGYGDSMNRGLEAARGTYIAILESDDRMDPEALEYMVGRAERENLEVLKCNFWLYWSTEDPKRGNRHDLYFPLASPEMVLMGPHAPIDYPQIFWAKASIWSALYRRDFLEKNNIRFLPTPGASYQDAGFTFKVLACARRMAYSSRAFLHYRQDNENSSVNSKGKVYCTCDEHAEMRRFLNEDRPDLKAALDPIRAYVKFVNYRWNYDRLADQFKPEFLERFAQEMREEVEQGNIPAGYFDGSLWGDPAAAGFLYFNPGEIQEISEMMSDPAYYAVHRACEKSGGKVETLQRYWHAGGLGYVTRALGGKVRR